ncbi:DsbA family protein [Taibaiella soli]|uniref:DsbA family protein n=1 Tax=Taibaiella soli TaxID=1649169 RepID=A0A2W2BSQ0_9BACT|nr:thioredoxin domain-containing protein [Taibaiella soli]PZF70763.1 DsbA family protein [Taibaiella soli]
MPLTPPVSEKDHIQGSPDAPIELLEYGDYQCPHCGRAYPIVKKIQEQLGDKVRLVFRNFPLTKIHPQAKMAALATEAADLQGKYWEMHDLVFENQKRLHHTALKEYAQSLGLNIDQFDQDLNREDLAEKVENHFYSGMRSGVNATPTFFINGEKYTESWEGDDLLNYLKNYFASKP